MRLDGFRCDYCGQESGQTPGAKWHEVRALHIGFPALGSGGFHASMSEGLHYCSKDCLKKAIDETWK